jgi:hypothetical protein
LEEFYQGVSAETVGLYVMILMLVVTLHVNGVDLTTWTPLVLVNVWSDMWLLPPMWVTRGKV